MILILKPYFSGNSICVMTDSYFFFDSDHVCCMLCWFFPCTQQTTEETCVGLQTDRCYLHVTWCHPAVKSFLLVFNRHTIKPDITLLVIKPKSLQSWVAPYFICVWLKVSKAYANTFTCVLSLSYPVHDTMFWDLSILSWLKQNTKLVHWCICIVLLIY